MTITSLPQVAPINITTLVADPLATRASVIIVNYNGGARLKQCLRSLLMGFDPSDEIILVDNASTDGSAEEVEQTFPGVRVIRSATNHGFGAGNNLGVRHASGKYLAFLNPDTVVEPGWLTALIQALEADPQVGLATSKILLLSEPGRINACGNDVHSSGLTLCRGLGMDRARFASSDQVGAVSGAAFAVRRELYELLGGFDEAFFMYMEDTDLSLRARLAGYHCVYTASSIVYHDYALRFGPQKIYVQERNRYLMLLKVMRWRTLAGLVPALLLAEVVTWGFVLLREPNRLLSKIRAYAWVVTNWALIMEKRQQTQTLRRVSDHDLLASSTHKLVYEQTGGGVVARLAHTLLDPLFLIFQKFALTVAGW